MSNQVHITRRERFNAAHKLWNEKWDASENKRVFGKCSNPNWHGHNYDLFVTVKGEPHAETGYCIDLKILSDILNERVIDKLDHKNLNLDVAFMAGKLTSTENLAIAIWNEIVEPIQNEGVVLHCVKLYETENNFVEYFG
jgi:6-pyruvoyltetrahydropterin/6-carboxytetrahydropterin synthase